MQQKSKALQITESLKSLIKTKRSLHESLSDVLALADDDKIAKAAQIAKTDEGDTAFHNEWTSLGDEFISAFEDWKATVDGSLADAAKEELGVNDESDLIVALKFIDENGY